MKTLKRMLLIHWHKYSDEIIEFANINFLTGKTGAGKSTIIDAMQLVLLGDTSGSFFNKAANRHSDRTLESYLYGELGDDGDTGYRYLRRQSFTSYVALEFEDTEKNQLFTVGFVCDCDKDLSSKAIWEWFILHRKGLPDNHFIDETTGVAFNRRALHDFCKKYCNKNDYEFFTTNKSFQKATNAKFGQINNKYRLLLKKSVPFQFNDDIAQFITKDICDIENNIEIEQMQSDIRQYKNLELEANVISEKIKALQEIETVYQQFLFEQGNLQKYHYILVKAKEKETLSEKLLKEELLEKKERNIIDNEENIAKLRAEEEKLKLQYEALYKEYYASDIVKRQESLQNNINELQAKLAQLQRNLQKALETYKGYGIKWNVHIKRLTGFGLSFDKKLIEMLTSLSLITENKLSTISLADIYEDLKIAKDYISSCRVEMGTKVQQLKEDIVLLEQTINNLQQGIKPYPQKVVKLKAFFEQELSKKYNKKIAIKVFADLLELRSEYWRNAVEGYLNTQKFYLFIPEEYYIEALELYNGEKRKDLFGVGIVDIAKIKKAHIPDPLPNSLAEEIIADSEDAKVYVNYLLGKIIKCEDVKELNKHKTAITPNCMLYKGFVSRRLLAETYSEPFIGRNAREMQLARKKQELTEKAALLDTQQTILQGVTKAAQEEIPTQGELALHQESILAAASIPDLKEELHNVQLELEGLDLLWTEKMWNQIVSVKEHSEAINNQWHELDKKNGILADSIKNIKSIDLPQLCTKLSNVQEDIVKKFEQSWCDNIGNPYFEDEQKKRKTKALQEHFRNAIENTKIILENICKRLRERRSAYNSKYNMAFDIESEHNDAFTRELENLSQVELPKYVDKIVDYKEKAYNQFRDDFIAKLKSNIETIEQQIKELNNSLKQSVFGSDRYRFIVKPKVEYRNYYNMFMDPLLMDTGGYNLMSDSFNDKYQNEITELFKKLIWDDPNGSSSKRAEFENNVKLFTDCKTYLVFDLVVTNSAGEEQRLSKTMHKKSGGETQTPFYIALLASFSQVCRVKANDNTIRIIILDEAFSKMDGERIRESISLLRRFGLQAIFSAPPEKSADIALLADNSIVVYNNGDYITTRNFGKEQLAELEA